jgi:hypothetical protein
MTTIAKWKIMIFSLIQQFKVGLFNIVNFLVIFKLLIKLRYWNSVEINLNPDHLKKSDDKFPNIAFSYIFQFYLMLCNVPTTFLVSVISYYVIFWPEIMTTMKISSQVYKWNYSTVEVQTKTRSSFCH